MRFKSDTFCRRNVNDGNRINPDAFPGNTNILWTKSAMVGRQWEMEQMKQGSGTGGEIVETKVVGKDESTRLA